MDETKLQTAREAVASGRFAEAAALLERLAHDHPDHAETAHALALCYAQMGMPDRALPAFERAATLAPADPALHVNRGAALSQAGRNPEAARAFRRALELDPTLAGAHYNLAQVLTRQGDLHAAAHHHAEAARLFPAAATFWRDLGRAEARLERWDAAIAAYHKAGEEDEDCHLDAKQELAVALERAGRDGEAEAAWRKLLATAPLLPIARNHLVALLAKRGALEEAESAAAAGVEAAPTHPDFQHNLGVVRSLRGNARGALDAWRRALLLDPARLETAQAIASIAPPPPPRAEIEHFNPFGESEHRIGLLTLRARESDDLSRAVAHLLPALLADFARAPSCELRHVAPFLRGTTRRAAVHFDYLDPGATRLAELTRALRVERWALGDVAPDLAAVRLFTWTAGAAAPAAHDLPLDLRDLPAALARAAAAARLDWSPAALPASADLLHFGLGAVVPEEPAALEHLLRAQAAAPFPAAEAEFLRRTLELVKRGDNPGAAAWLDRLIALRPTPRAWFLKGQTLFGQERFDEAQSAWQEARRLDPALRLPLLPAAWAELKIGRLASAENLFRAAAADADEGAGALVGLGCVELARKDPRRARERFLEALERQPRLPEALFEMAMSHVAEGNAAEAARWGRKLEQHHPGHPLVEALFKVLGRG